MSDIKVKLDTSNGNDFVVAIRGAVKERFDDVSDEVTDMLADIAKRGVAIVKKASYPHYRKHKGKHYRTGWRLTKTDDGFFINNKSKPHLTHLLNNGFLLVPHDKYGVYKLVKGDKHIDKAAEEIERLVDREIGSLK